MFSYIIILAGGVGTRLWPASTSSRPKQFMALRDGTTFFGRSLARALALNPSRGVLVVTGESQADSILEECRKTAGERATGPEIRVLPEPIGRNTAPAVAYALSAVSGEGSEAGTMLLMTSDHIIEPVSSFLEDAQKAEALASEGNLVCFGIPPRYAATGYGYIEAAAPLGPGFRAASFREKPDKESAEGYLAAGHFFWNSGMYAFRTDRMREELDEYAPDISKAFLSLKGKPAWRDVTGTQVVKRWEGLEKAYALSPSVSLDYAVSEKSRRVAVVKASFSWDDVGSWDEMARLFPEGSSEVFSVDSDDCFVYSDMPVALCGVSGLTVVIRNGSALILKKGSAQLVKGAVEAIKTAGRSDLI